MQCAAVNEAFAKHCEELDDAKHKLEYHLKKVSVILEMLATGVIASFEKITVDLSSRKNVLIHVRYRTLFCVSLISDKSTSISVLLFLLYSGQI